MTSLAPNNSYQCALRAANCIEHRASDLAVKRIGLLQFVKNQDNARKNNRKSPVISIAKQNGVNLPVNIIDFPDKTLAILKAKGITPDFINPTQDNSLMIEFKVDGIYHMAEFHTDGDIVLLKKSSDELEAWDLRSGNYFDKLIEQLEVEPDLELV